MCLNRNRCFNPNERAHQYGHKLNGIRAKQSSRSAMNSQAQCMRLENNHLQHNVVCIAFRYRTTTSNTTPAFRTECDYCNTINSTEHDYPHNRTPHTYRVFARSCDARFCVLSLIKINRSAFDADTSGRGSGQGDLLRRL